MSARRAPLASSAGGPVRICFPPSDSRANTIRLQRFSKPYAGDGPLPIRAPCFLGPCLCPLVRIVALDPPVADDLPQMIVFVAGDPADHLCRLDRGLPVFRTFTRGTLRRQWYGCLQLLFGTGSQVAESFLSH